MRWNRFLAFLLCGLVLSISVACSTAVLKPSQPQAEIATPPPAEAQAEETPPAKLPLSPETAALVASAGPNGLYNPPRGDVRLVVISDLNSAYGSTDYEPEVDKGIQLIPFWQPDLVVSGGDMVAGQSPSLTAAQIAAMWAAFDEHVAAPLRKANIPFGFTIGNHDASGARGVRDQFLFQQERDLASAYWNAPEHNPGLQFVDRYEFPYFYTFKQGDIFFLVWDGSTDQIPADKLAWVEKTLASEAAQQAKMRVLLGHLPLYGVAVGRDEPGEVMADADQLRAMLERYKVHTYISGHHHAYYPAHRGNLQLLHTGILGAGPRPLIEGDLPAWKTITVIDVDFESPELTTYTTYNMQTLERIEPEVLPRFLTGHNGLVLRRDVPWDSLSPTEQEVCAQRIGKALCSAS
ncbi:MAG TPA: metallophosphoesterase [Leptolyngbyaceae cyanobacterium]